MVFRYLTITQPFKAPRILESSVVSTLATVMTSFDAKRFLSPKPLDSRTVFPDDIWISPQKPASHHRKQGDEHRNKSIPFSISDINDSDFYSTDEIVTTGVSGDEQVIQAKKPPLPPRKHAKQKKTSKQRKPHFQEEPDYIPTSNTTERPPPHIQAVRSAIERLGDDPKYVKTSHGLASKHQEEQKQSGEPSRSPDVFEANEDSFSMELSNFVRKASLRTKKVFRKMKSSDLVTSPRKFWRRNKIEVREGVSSESLSTADPSASYHLPQEVSPVSNRSAGASSAGDMDIPFSNSMREERSRDKVSREAERGDGNRELDKRTYSALRYVQKLRSRSRVGGLIPRSRTRNVGEDMDGDESTWNSTSKDYSLRRRLARSLSF